MRVRNENYCHFRNLEIGGEPTDLGNGIDVDSSSGTGTIPKIKSVGDDANVGLTLATQQGAGTWVDRFIMNPTPKTIVDGSATSLFEVAVTTGQMVGGIINFLVRASDGTDHQALAGIASYSAGNKGGTVTCTVTNATGNDAKTVTGASTLTLAWTIAAGTNKATVKLQPTGSLTETTYTVEYNVVPIRGAITIL